MVIPRLPLSDAVFVLAAPSGECLHPGEGTDPSQQHFIVFLSGWFPMLFFFFERQGNNSSETQRHLPKSTQLIRDRVGLRPGCLVLACLGSVSESERSTPAQESAGRWSGVTVVGRSSGRASGDANLAAEDEED